MLSKIVCDLLNYFRELIAAEKTAYNIKQRLIQLPSFSASTLFRKIAHPRDCITIKSLKSFLESKLAINDREIYELFEKFDHRRCGFILQQDFVRELCSQIDGSVQQRSMRNGQVTNDIEMKFVQLISTMVRGCRVVDVWRKELQQAKPYVIFEMLNMSKTGTITPRQLTQLFLNHGQQLNQQDKHALFYALKRRCHQQINLETFCQNINPLEFGYYPNFKHHFQRQIQLQLDEKATLAKEAAEIQENYLKNRRNSQIVACVHKEAALLREKELEKRVQDELTAYRDLKYATKRKYHPSLTYQEFLVMEKENQTINVLRSQQLAEEARLKEQAYIDRLKNIDALREIQQFQQHKHAQSSGVDPFVKGSTKMSRRELERKIKAHAFSVRQADDILLRRRVQREILPNAKLL